jgi:hypothetical protein
MIRALSGGLCWRRAGNQAPMRGIALTRLGRVKALSITFRQNTLEIMERDVYP